MMNGGLPVQLQAFIPTEPVVEMNDVQTAPVNLFVIHPIDGSVFTLQAAMSRMKSVKVYGLQCVDGSPMTSIEDLAAEYIRRMRAIQPAGPYRIAGYSLGAGIGIEMALQLQKQASASTSGVDCSVPLLILIDTTHASLSPYTGKTKDDPDVKEDVAKLESELICKFVSIMTSMFAESSKTAARIDMEKLAAEIANAKDFESRARLATTALRASGLIDSSAAEKTERAMQATLRRIIMAGLWKPAMNIDASTRVILVRASDSFTHARMLGQDYGLSELCRGKVDVHILKGSHETIVQPASDGSCPLVDVLQGALSV
jgi:fatty acid synthase